MVSVFSSTTMAEKISFCCALMMTTLLVLSCCEVGGRGSDFNFIVNQKGVMNKGCDEIYVVGEGESLHTISEKCGDPYIVEENPHINDPDDVFPGLVIKITPFNLR
ncbi:uncharacterized protein LOC122724691 [Manihot esculenta]|uniref:Uncharacterized protein n=1 Tax=Manihot esculenta TaxID=3983 RepID=A0ACB7H328_MANES|nr:uncharacterized protein LOC122724691 [Manihot esculenta]KAG8647068.1 hypothetical protein MANES_09G056950v8 [Manihot esculenta]